MTTAIGFGEALSALQNGSRVRRAAWAETVSLRLSPQRPDSDALFVFIDGEMETGRPILEVKDIIAADWAVLADSPGA